MLNPLRDRVIELSKQHWLTIVPVLGLIASLLVSVSEATWYPEAEPLIVLVLGGAVYGGLLAASRWRLRTVLILNAVVAIGVTLIAVGRIVPTLGAWVSSPLATSATVMQLRLFGLLDQLARGLGQFRPETLPGRQVLIVAYGLLVWQATAWLIWSIGRGRRALSGVLACALPLAINIVAAGKAASLPMLFTICGVFVIARTAYLDQTRGWEARRIGYPELVGEDWTYSVVIISIAVLLLAGLTTPEWQASLKRFLDSFKPPAVAVQSAASISTPQSGPTPGGFVPDLSVVGEPIPPDSNATIFRVTIDDPARRIGAGGELQPPDRTHYWRGGIFGAYTGRGWEPIGLAEEPRLITPTLAPPGRYALRQEFDIIAAHADQLFAVNDPITSSAKVRRLSTDDSAVLRGAVSLYTVTSWATAATVNQLDADSTQYPANIREAYVQVPDVPQRVRDLADGLTAGADSPYDKAVRIQNYLRTTYRYRLDVPPAPAGRDVVDYFLFDAPGGFCSYFASAMVVMLRLEGVPARVVSGYAMGDYDATQRAYRVPASSAHAWVEVYFPTYGWVEFEPTTSQAVFAYRADAAPPPVESTPAPGVETIISGNVLVIGAGLLGVIGLIGLAVMLRRRFVWQRRSADHQMSALYWQMRRSLTALKVNAPASVTPIEFVADYLHPIESRPRLRAAVRDVSEMYVAATYTAQPPTREAVQALRRAWRQMWVERLRVRLKDLSGGKQKS